MRQIEKKQGALSSFRKSICVSISKFLLSIYGNFRSCSGVKEQTDKVEKKHRDNEEKICIVEENLPRVMSEAEKLIDRNSYLEKRVVFMFNELHKINSFAVNGDCNLIVIQLQKYDFNKKLEY
jgi:hypothetical protein